MLYNEDEIKRIVRETVHETLAGIGIFANNPQETQADFVYIRKIRTGSEMLSRTIKTGIISALVPSVIYLLWQAIKQALER